ncbi:MAG: ATP-binding protein [Bacteroidales bacterium]|nr:ATP-binding protein [Bacteroidales bacterium]
MNDLREIIVKIIEGGTEGGFWDFKRSWHESNADLLHDIICMANNIENRDAYIIIGVANSGEFNDISSDENRKITEQLINFLRTKRFVGQFRPIVKVETLSIEGNTLDVIVIENTTNTPYVLEEDFVDKKRPQADKHKVIKQGNIYTRIQDTNTPVDKTADYDKAELLWKKRFHLNASPLDRFNYYIKDTANWIFDSYANELYYKYSNELFKIKELSQGEKGTNTVWDFIGMYRPWSKFRVEITWQNVVIKTDEVISNSKYSVLMPDFPHLQFENDTNRYYYWCYVMNSNRELLNRLIIRVHSKAPIMNFDPNIICFNNVNEKTDFEDYLYDNWSMLKSEFDKIEDNQDITDRIFQNDFKCTKFFPQVFKQWKNQRSNN